MAVCCESSVDGKNVSKVATRIITPKLLRKTCSLQVKAGREYAIRRGIPHSGPLPNLILRTLAASFRLRLIGDLEGVVCRVQGLLPFCHSSRIAGFNNSDERRVRMSHFAASKVVHGELLNWPKIRCFFGF